MSKYQVCGRFQLITEKLPRRAASFSTNVLLRKPSFRSVLNTTQSSTRVLLISFPA